MKWFSFSGEGWGFTFHDTEEEAKAAAEKEFSSSFYGNDGLPESPEREAVWGRVHGLPRQVAHIDTPDGEFDHLEEWDILSPDAEVEVTRKRRWIDEHGDEQEKVIP